MVSSNATEMQSFSLADNWNRTLDNDESDESEDRASEGSDINADGKKHTNASVNNCHILTRTDGGTFFVPKKCA